MSDEQKYFLLITYIDKYEAEFTKGYLKSNGVKAILKHYRAYPLPRRMNAWEIWVPESKRKIAAKLLDDIKASD